MKLSETRGPHDDFLSAPEASQCMRMFLGSEAPESYRRLVKVAYGLNAEPGDTFGDILQKRWKQIEDGDREAQAMDERVGLL